MNRHRRRFGGEPSSIREAVQEEHARRERLRAAEIARRDVEAYDEMLRDANGNERDRLIGRSLRARRHLVSVIAREQLPETNETSAFVARLARALELGRVPFDALDVIARALEPPYDGDSE